MYAGVGEDEDEEVEDEDEDSEEEDGEADGEDEGDLGVGRGSGRILDSHSLQPCRTRSETKSLDSPLQKLFLLIEAVAEVEVDTVTVSLDRETWSSRLLEGSLGFCAASSTLPTAECLSSPGVSRLPCTASSSCRLAIANLSPRRSLMRRFFVSAEAELEDVEDDPEDSDDPFDDVENLARAPTSSMAFSFVFSLCT